MLDTESWCVEDSDDEANTKTDIYEPSAEEICRLYDLLDQGITPELKWQSPGYRPPTPVNIPTTPVKEESNLVEEKSDFDFMDDMSSSQLVLRQGDTGLKGSAKKKTTSLDGVLSNMRRHRNLDQQMMDNQTTNSSNNIVTSSGSVTTSATLTPPNNS